MPDPTFDRRAQERRRSIRRRGETAMNAPESETPQRHRHELRLSVAPAMETEGPWTRTPGPPNASSFQIAQIAGGSEGRHSHSRHCQSSGPVGYFRNLKSLPALFCLRRLGDGPRRPPRFSWGTANSQWSSSASVCVDYFYGEERRYDEQGDRLTMTTRSLAVAPSSSFRNRARSVKASTHGAATTTSVFVDVSFQIIFEFIKSLQAG
jgi:hypothetical protein